MSWFKQKTKHYKINIDHSFIFGSHWPKVKAMYVENAKEVGKLSKFIFKYILSRLTFNQVRFQAQELRNCHLSIDPIQGQVLYGAILALRPKLVFEYGTSFGLSTLYLSAALHKIQAGRLIGSELEPTKAHKAMENLKGCDLDKGVELITGDLLQCGNQIPEGIDFVFMDGFPNLNLAVFKLLEPKLASDAVILTDDVHLFSKEMRDFLHYLKSNPNLQTKTLPISNGMQLTLLKPSQGQFQHVENLLINESIK